MRYQETVKYLDSFVNYENKATFSYGRSLKLERVKVLFQSLDIPYKSLPVIHIAGTKGKGSTATFCANILAASGFAAGLYTSPHFFDFRERIKIVRNSQKQGLKNSCISKSQIVRIVKEIRPILEKLRFTKTLGKLTFFEVYTAIAFKYFIEKGVDAAVLETGLGGRCDATNVASPLACIITHIGYDHTDILGKKLADIAYEKAGIIKRAVPVVCSLQRRSVAEVIDKKCKLMNTDLFVLRKDFTVRNVRIKKRGSRFDFCFQQALLRNLKLPPRGRCQVENAALAIAAVWLLKNRDFAEREIKYNEGLSGSFLEGRFEIARRLPLVIMDIAHNPSSFESLRQNLKEYFPAKKIILIFAASRGKDIKGMLAKINHAQIIITRFRNSRAMFAEEIQEKGRIKNAFITADIKEALKLAGKLYNRNSLILISGSFFLVSEAKKILKTGYRL